MTVSRIWSRVLSPHYPDVLVGADLRVRPEEGNHAGLPLQRNCPGPMRRHPLQSTPSPPLGLTLGQQRGGERSLAWVQSPFSIGEHAEFSAQGKELVVAEAELAPPGMVEPLVIVDEKGFIHEQTTRLESTQDLRKQVPLQVVEHGDQLEGGGGNRRLLLEVYQARGDGGEPERLGRGLHLLKRRCVPVPGLDVESFLGEIERVPAAFAG